MIDLFLSEDGRFAIGPDQEIVLISGHDEVIQAVQTLLRTFLGEWWLNTRHGIDWLGAFFPEDRTFQRARADRELRKKVLAVAGVLRIDALTIALSADGSEVSIGLTLTTIYNQQATLEETITP